MSNRPVLMTVPERLRKALDLVRELQRTLPAAATPGDLVMLSSFQKDLDIMDDYLTDRLAKEHST